MRVKASTAARVVSLEKPNRAKMPWEIVAHTAVHTQARGQLSKYELSGANLPVSLQRSAVAPRSANFTIRYEMLF